MARTVTLPATVAALALGVVSAAQADGTTVVGTLACANSGGHATVASGTELVVRFGWAAATRGLVQDFLGTQTTTIALGGGTPVDVSGEYGEPTQRADGSWSSSLLHPTGVTLGAGQSITFEVRADVSHLVYDGALFGGPGIVWDSTCTVTAA